MQEKYEIILSKSTILIAEDDKNIQESFAKVLRLFVLEVYCANNGEEALYIYKKNNPDIIITDIKMPKMSGLELIKKIRERDQDIPIIVTSAYTDQDFLLESIKLALIEYVVKPIKESDLEKLLQECAKKIDKSSKITIELNSTCRYDYDNKIVIDEDKYMYLTHKEVEFFEMLLAHRGNLVTKQAIEDKLYVYEEAPLSALKNLVFKLRKKIGNDIVKTVNKLGYIIN